MPYRDETYDEWDDDAAADDLDGDLDANDEDEESTLPCPYCRVDIHEDAQRCPSCGEYISEEDRPPRGQPRWILVTALVCLLLIYLWIAGR